LCLAYDRWASYVWAIEHEQLTPILTIRGRAVLTAGVDGAFVASTMQEFLWVDPDRRVGVRFPRSDRPSHLFDGGATVAVAPGEIGIADPGLGTLSVYQLP